MGFPERKNLSQLSPSFLYSTPTPPAASGADLTTTTYTTPPRLRPRHLIIRSARGLVNAAAAGIASPDAICSDTILAEAAVFASKIWPTQATPIFFHLPAVLPIMHPPWSGPRTLPPAQ